jgi:phosphoketolase
MHSAVRTHPERGPLPDTDLERIDAYWRAANYLSVGQLRSSMLSSRETSQSSLRSTVTRG